MTQAFTLATIFAFLLLSFGVYLFTDWQLEKGAAENIRSLAGALLERNMAMHRYFSEELKPKLFSIIPTETLDSGYYEPAWMSSSYALQKIDSYFEGVHYRYKEAAANARNPASEADAFEQEFLKRLSQQPDLLEETLVRRINGVPYFIFYRRGETFVDGCLRCHGDAESAPPGLVRRYGPERGFGKVTGEVASAVSIRIPIAEAAARHVDFRNQFLFWAIAVLSLICFFQWYLVKLFLLKPIHTLNRKVKTVAKGDLSANFVAETAYWRDMQTLNRSFSVMTKRLRRNQQDMEEKIEQGSVSLQAAHKTLGTFFHLSPLAMLIMDREGRVLEWNPAAEKCFGWTAAEVIGKFLPFALEERRHIYHQLWDDLKNAGYISGHEGIARSKDGTQISVRLSCAPKLAPSGEFESVFLILENISAQKAAEQKLRASEKKYRQLSQEFHTLLNGISTALGLIDKDYNMLWINQATASLAGKTVDQIELSKCYRMWHQRETPCPDCPVTECFSTGKPISTTLESFNRRIHEVSILPLRNERGDVDKVIRLGTDITETLRLREETVQANALALLGKLAAGVVHEINNPNSLIQHNCATLETVFQKLQPGLIAWGGKNTSELPAGLSIADFETTLPQLITNIQAGSQRIAKTVQELRAYCPGDTRKKQPLSLNIVAEKVARLSQQYIKKYTRHFSFEPALDLPLVAGDPDRLGQVILNLLMNACQALENQQQEIKLITGIASEGNNVFLQVIDRGKGIPQAIIDHLTDPFFSTKKEQKGTGLGLAVADWIMREHGGSLSFESEPSCATKVTFYLPIYKGESDDAGDLSGTGDFTDRR